MAAADSRPASLVNVFRRLWPQIWRYRLRVGIALAFLVVAKLANIGVPLVLKHLVDALDVAPKPLLIPLLQLTATRNTGFSPASRSMRCRKCSPRPCRRDWSAPRSGRW